MSFSLIVPIAADKPEYTDEIPYLFNPGNEGLIPCIQAIRGLDLSVFDCICFTILKKHDSLYSLQALFENQFKQLSLEKKAKLIILDVPTSSQPETIVRTIEIAKLEGSVMIKDADSYFESDLSPHNSVATFPLDALRRVNPQDKSYVAVDDMFYITNIIEKKIISRYFCAGGYVFEDAAEFCNYYGKLKNYKGLYLSHIIYAMLLNNKDFRPIPVKKYQDWGTKEDWQINKI
jgi:hypothetical protein